MIQSPQERLTGTVGDQQDGDRLDRQRGVAGDLAQKSFQDGLAAAFIPDAFASAIAFLDSARENPPECLILDLQMPGMIGLEVMRYLSQRNIRIPTIVITAHTEFADEATCLSAGAAAFLRKPFDALAPKNMILSVVR